MYRAHVEATMLDDETAEFLSTDQGWLEAQWPDCRAQAINAGKTVNGNPSFVKYTKLNTTPDGNLYDFEFDVPTTN